MKTATKLRGFVALAQFQALERQRDRLVEIASRFEAQAREATRVSNGLRDEAASKANELSSKSFDLALMRDRKDEAETRCRELEREVARLKTLVAELEQALAPVRAQERARAEEAKAMTEGLFD